jgi:hypothetical protein
LTLPAAGAQRSVLGGKIADTRRPGPPPVGGGTRLLHLCYDTFLRPSRGVIRSTPDGDQCSKKREQERGASARRPFKFALQRIRVPYRMHPSALNASSRQRFPKLPRDRQLILSCG